MASICPSAKGLRPRACAPRRLVARLVARASSEPTGASSESTGASTAAPVNKEALMKTLDAAYDMYKRAPGSQKVEFSGEVLASLKDLKDGEALPKWGVANTGLARRTVFQNELRMVGIKSPDKIAVPSIRNDAAFLTTVVLTTSLGAVLCQAFLPGELGFFSSYLVGGISIVVLAIGSTSPGLLQYFIEKFSMVFPDFKERVIRHEAAHFLVGYLLGVPVTGYSLELGREHTEFAEAQIQKRIIERMLEDEEIDVLSLVAVAGVAAEGQQYEEIMGQNADLMDLQRILLRSKTKMNNNQQQNITRWAVYNAAAILRQYKKEHEALMEAMGRGAPVVECIKAIEAA